MKEKDDMQSYLESKLQKLKIEKEKDVEFETHELKEKKKELEQENKKFLSESEEIKGIILSQGEPVDSTEGVDF